MRALKSWSLRLLVPAIAVAATASVAGGQAICGEWSQVPAAPGSGPAITDVVALSEDSAFAFDTALGAIQWDGTAWNPLALPDLSGLGSSSVLEAAVGIAPGKVFVAGVVYTGTWTSEQLLLEWDGADWTVRGTLELQDDIAGAPRGGAPRAVAGVAEDDLWILGLASGTGTGVGGPPILTVHWDGSKLTEVVTPGVGNRQNNVLAATAIAGNDMWAVGEYSNVGTGDSAFHGLTYHYDGSTWNPVPNPTQSIASTHLHAVAAVSTNDIWAAGDSPSGPLFMHWDGSAWTIVPAPLSTATIRQLAVIASDDIWAVDTPWQYPLIGKYHHWDGTAWSVVTPPVIPGATNATRAGGLAVVGPCDVWAVGTLDVGSGPGPFIERLQAGGPVQTGVHALGSGGEGLAVSPNPTRRGTEIRLRSPGDRLARVVVYDVHGREIRTVLGRGGPAGDGVAWDGRDADGRPVPGGVYFLRASTENGNVLARKLTVVR